MMLLCTDKLDMPAEDSKPVQTGLQAWPELNAQALLMQCDQIRELIYMQQLAWTKTDLKYQPPVSVLALPESSSGQMPG